jgi:hypothetical protein
MRFRDLPERTESPPGANSRASISNLAGIPPRAPAAATRIDKDLHCANDEPDRKHLGSRSSEFVTCKSLQVNIPICPKSVPRTVAAPSSRPDYAPPDPGRGAPRASYPS